MERENISRETRKRAREEKSSESDWSGECIPPIESEGEVSLATGESRDSAALFQIRTSHIKLRREREHAHALSAALPSLSPSPPETHFSSSLQDNALRRHTEIEEFS